MYTYSWADAGTQKNRLEALEEEKENPWIKRKSYQFKCLVRSTKIINYMDKKKGTMLEKVYTFVAYDLLDYGVWYYVKRLFRKMLSRK